MPPDGTNDGRGRARRSPVRPSRLCRHAAGSTPGGRRSVAEPSFRPLDADVDRRARRSQRHTNAEPPGCTPARERVQSLRAARDREAARRIDDAAARRTARLVRVSATTSRTASTPPSRIFSARRRLCAWKSEMPRLGLDREACVRATARSQSTRSTRPRREDRPRSAAAPRSGTSGSARGEPDIVRAVAPAPRPGSGRPPGYARTSDVKSDDRADPSELFRSIPDVAGAALDPRQGRRRDPGRPIRSSPGRRRP